MSSFESPIKTLVESMEALSIRRETIAGCNVPAIVSHMYNEQSDHLFSKFSVAFIKYRQVVVEWMIDVAEYFHLHPTTTHAAIAYLDRLQPNEHFSRFEWQMLAICCLIISSKYNEMEEHVPSLQQLEEITQQSITNDCVLSYELWALKRMGWKLNARTPMAFLACYITQGVVFPQDDFLTTEAWNESSSAQKRHLEQRMVGMATKFIIDVRFKPMPASAVAAAIVFLVRQQCHAKQVWSERLSYICLHDPASSSKVQEVLRLYEEMCAPDTTAAETFVEVKNSLSSPAAPTEDASSAHSSSAMRTPVPKAGGVGDKENSKPQSDISPVSIMDMNLVA